MHNHNTSSTITISSSDELLLDLLIVSSLVLKFSLKLFNKMKKIATVIILIMTLMPIIIKNTSLRSFILKNKKLIHCIVNVGAVNIQIIIVLKLTTLSIYLNNEQLLTRMKLSKYLKCSI